jgi:cobalt-zinc-cadmium efflux system outer membrane protein
MKQRILGISPATRTNAIAPMALTTVLAISGCASGSPRKAQRELDQMIQNRSGLSLRSGENRSDLAVKETTRALLKEPLTAEAAVQLALLNNSALRAKLEEAGVAQADLVQAGLLENPRFHGAWRFPSGGGADHTGQELGITESFMDILALPLRRKLADAQFEQAKFRLSHDLLGLTAEVKESFFDLQAEEQRLVLRRTTFETMDAAAKLWAGQRQAGNVSALDAAREQAAVEEARLDLKREEAETANERERLALLMGVQDMAEWTISETLTNLPPADPDLKQLETTALTQRWDLAAARKEPLVLKEALRVNRLGWISGLSVGIDSEKDLDGKFGIGPSVEWNVPLFDRQQASSAKIKAQSRQSDDSIEALESSIRYEVRKARTSLVVAHQAAVAYRDTLLPLQENILNESLKHYNFMLLGVYQLLQVKRDELRTRGAYIDALKDYWTALTQLERAVGGKISMPAPTPPAPEPQNGEKP